MPELLFDVRWPDGSVMTCYSPSTAVAPFFGAGRVYEMADFITRARAALRAASNRVRAVHGMPCGRAAATLRLIEARAADFPTDAHVTFERFHASR